VIPSNAFTTNPIQGSFRPPNDLDYDPLHQIVWGGQAIGDGTKGRLVKYWEVALVTEGITVRPVNGPIAFTLTGLDISQITSVSLAFDSNMGLAIAYTVSTGANLYYFDSLSSQYTTRFFADINSCRLCVDDARDFYSSASDVIFAYTRVGNVYWRQQRDRYNIERLIGASPNKLIRIGQTFVNRLQLELLTE
jgi:hypothetical protein